MGWWQTLFAAAPPAMRRPRCRGQPTSLLMGGNVRAQHRGGPALLAQGPSTTFETRQVGKAGFGEYCASFPRPSAGYIPDGLTHVTPAPRQHCGPAICT